MCGKVYSLLASFLGYHQLATTYLLAIQEKSSPKSVKPVKCKVQQQKGVRQFTKEQEAYKHTNYIGDEQEITSKSSFLWA